MLIGLLRSTAAGAPHRPFLRTSERTITYGEALDRAESLARGLRVRSIERFACAGSAVDLIPLLCAATAVGAEACVYPVGLVADEVERLAARFDHHVLIGDLPGAMPIDALGVDGVEVFDAADRAQLLVLTTGTTGEPKGVRHDWRRLAAMVKRTEDDRDACWLFAYNLNQFAGLQVVLHVLASGSTLALPRTNQPRHALDAMRDLGVTHASATPTFWRFLVALIDEQTASALRLRQITLGGEAVPGPLLERLEVLFPNARVSQVYAANEFGSSVSVRDGRSGLPLSVLDRGEEADVQMRIVDGELHVRSRVGMLGYYGEDDASDGWRPTGDLVEVHGDRIVFAGRRSEIINVGGVKVHPLPIEELVQAVDGVQLVHAYGRSNPVTGQIVAVDVVARDGVDTDVLSDLIRDACASLDPAARPRRIRFVDELETAGSKIVRKGTPTPQRSGGADE